MNQFAVVDYMRTKKDAVGASSDTDGWEIDLPDFEENEPFVTKLVDIIAEPEYDTCDELFKLDDAPVQGGFATITDILIDDAESTTESESATGSIEDFVSTTWGSEINEDVDDYMLVKDGKKLEDLDSGEEADDESDIQNDRD